MKRILFAWVGMNDLKASREGKEGELGPIARVATEMEFSRLVLLNNYGEEEAVPSYVEWLKERCHTPVDLMPALLPSPIDFAAIYVAAKSAVGKILRQEKGQTRPVFHLSPGTPAMAAVWIMLGKGPFAEAELVQSSREQGVQAVKMPFNIFTEYIPDLQAGADRRLLQLCDGPQPYETEFGAIVHQCQTMRTLVAQARLVAKRNIPVLLEGETGTGKELFARAIHEESVRSSKNFVAVNCGAIPRELFESEFFGYKKGAFTGATGDHGGYFEQAHQGTLFLDELGELPADAQVKVLRVLNDGKVRRIGDSVEREVDVRVIAATNRNLLQEVAEGRFRADLFYRIAVAVLHLPPLREREGDLSLLLDTMLERINEDMGREPEYRRKKFSVNAKKLMARHPWPGNAREMHNTILRLCVWCQQPVIHEEDVQRALLPSPGKMNDDILQRPLGYGFNLKEIHEVIASHYIRRALDEARGNKSKAAKLLGFANYQTLANWIKKYGIE